MGLMLPISTLLSVSREGTGRTLGGSSVAHRLTVIGTGYLGATHAACMADLGFEVLGIDVDPRKIARLRAGELPFCEPDLEPILRRNLRRGRLRFTTSWDEAAEFGD